AWSFLDSVGRFERGQETNFRGRGYNNRSEVQRTVRTREQFVAQNDHAELGGRRGRVDDAPSHLAHARQGRGRVEASAEARLQGPQREPRGGGPDRGRTIHGRSQGGDDPLQLRLPSSHEVDARDVVREGGDEEEQERVRLASPAGIRQLASRAAVPERREGELVAGGGIGRRPEGRDRVGIRRDAQGVRDARPRGDAVHEEAPSKGELPGPGGGAADAPAGVRAVRHRGGRGRERAGGSDPRGVRHPRDRGGDVGERGGEHAEHVRGVGSLEDDGESEEGRDVEGGVQAVREAEATATAPAESDRVPADRVVRQGPLPQPLPRDFVERRDAGEHPGAALDRERRRLRRAHVPHPGVLRGDIEVRHHPDRRAVQRVNPHFIASGGKFSIIGHSLGSVIAWDILSILKDSVDKNMAKGTRKDPIRIDVLDSPVKAPSLATLENGATDTPMGYRALAKGEANDSKHGTWGPCLPKKMLQTIPFVPDLTIFLGSPIGLFLALRGAHPVFDEMRAVAEAARASLIPCDNDEAEPPPVFDVSPIICSPFSLPTGSLYNIFHPSDPVAYRIEPMLLPEGVQNHEFPPPIFLSPDGKTLRLHVKARQVGDQLFQGLGSLSRIFDKSVENAAAAQAASDAEASRKRSMSGSGGKESSERPKFSGCIKGRECSFRLGGKSPRVDFQIQPGVIDNEYLSAVTAHSSYFVNDDVIDFIIFNTRWSDDKMSNQIILKNY
ncbi:hypothetical protein ACHAWF_016730, partial [Thalassiosira exigua]